MGRASEIGLEGGRETRCRVCGCGEVETDWVFDDVWWRLDECPHCDHRWTAAGAPPPRVLPSRPAPTREREVASAA